MTTPGFRMPIVERPRLFDLLDAAARCRLTVVDAHAGAGKTVLLASWLERSQQSAVTWVRLESADNDRRVFWSYLLKALQQGPVTGRPTARNFQESVARLDGPLLLVLDRAQKLRDATVLAELEQVLLETSSDFRVVLSGRGRPVWPFPLLRARGDLAEIGFADLAFTLAEATEFFALAGLDLSPEEVATVLERTRGGALDLDLVARTERHGRGSAAHPPASGAEHALSWPEPSAPGTDRQVSAVLPSQSGPAVPPADTKPAMPPADTRPEVRGRHVAPLPGRHAAPVPGRHAAPVGWHAPSVAGGAHAAPATHRWRSAHWAS